MKQPNIPTFAISNSNPALPRTKLISLKLLLNVIKPVSPLPWSPLESFTIQLLSETPTKKTLHFIVVHASPSLVGPCLELPFFFFKWFNFSISSLTLVIFLLSFFKFIIYLFLAGLGLRCCARASSSCVSRGLLFIVVHGFLIAVASLCCRAWALGARASEVVACGLSSCGLWALERRLSSCGAWA